MTTSASVAASSRQTSAGASVVVASSCPRCGAPLDFAAGSNAVRCTHCASMLLVTGRRHVLSYVVRARVPPSEARALASFASTPGAMPLRRGEPRLVFIPYYRLTAEEVFWRREKGDSVRVPPVTEPEGIRAQLVRIVSGSVRERDDAYAISLASRTIERNFLACDAGGLASWSLGLRPSVLRLELLQRAALEEQGVVLRPTIAAEAALARALEPRAEPDAIHRDVLRAVLSLVYFPLWTIATGAGSAVCLTVVDGVTGSIVARNVDPSVLDGLGCGGSPAERVLGFRPLSCPNCGWDLPVRAIDVVFHCVSCERTWELVGEDLEPITSDVVLRAGAPRDLLDGPYLPVWQVSGVARVIGDGPRATLPEHLFAPAFHWRALKGLCDLGARLAREIPVEPELEPSKTIPLVGCSLDQEDAVTMARLVALKLLMDDSSVRHAAEKGRELPQVEIVDSRMRLVWLPFAGDAYSVREPFTGYALPRRSVEEVVRG